MFVSGLVIFLPVVDCGNAVSVSGQLVKLSGSHV